MKKLLSLLLVPAVVIAVVFTGCTAGDPSAASETESEAGYTKNTSLSDEAVTLTLTGMTASFKSMESVISSFRSVYPNCTINYEYVQDYSKSIATRLGNNDNVDIFITNNITADSALKPYALDLLAGDNSPDLSDTYDGLIHNFEVTENGGTHLYAVPLGGEVRGLFVNRTLLSSLGLTEPTNYTELMSCCASLKKAGYIPFQGNPGTFGQQLMYPYICALIADSDDYSAVYNRVASCEAGVSELFREPMTRLYEMVSDGYYNYKTVESDLGLFTDGQDETTAMNFLNILKNADGAWTKKDDVGQTAFMPGTMSIKALIDKEKDDYHSLIDYDFILSPVTDNGGFAYLSPSSGIAINKNSANSAWAVEFLNYLFSAQVNRSFAAEENIIPNTADALGYIKTKFAVGDDHICQLGEVTFDYVFYNIIKKALIEVSKANNPKYMQADGTMYDLEYYMNNLESAFSAQRETETSTARP